MVRQIANGKWQNYTSKLKILLLLIFTLNFYLFTFSFCLSYAEAISSKELIENAKALDGKIVKYEGEAITAILNRGEHSWINLNDGKSAIGIWCRNSQLASVGFIGDYKNRGDILEIEGRFNRACPVHGGELDIHAENVKIIKQGFAIEEKADTRKLNLAIAIFSIVLLIAVIFRKRL